MPSLMCTAPLLRRLGYRPPRRRPTDNALPGVRLHGWGATTFVDDDGADLVLAVERHTQLAIVFQLDPVDLFRQRFAEALGMMLEELHVPSLAVQRETAAVFALPLSRLGNREVRASLSTLRYFCELELCYHEDLGRVQSNLNDFPHQRPPHVAKAAVAQLFWR